MSDKGGKLNKEGLFMVLNNIEVVQAAYISKTGEPHNEYHGNVKKCAVGRHPKSEMLTICAC